MDERRAVLYSFNLFNKKKTLNDTWYYDALRCSIDSIRKYNTRIPIYVYLSPRDVYADMNIDVVSTRDNIAIEYFDSLDNYYHLYKHPRFVQKGFCDVLNHKWLNAFRLVQDKNFDRVLYIDPDTIVHQDIEQLFEIYNNTESLYAKPVSNKHALRVSGVKGAMNDGQFLLSKSVVSKLFDNFLQDQAKWINWFVDLTEIQQRFWLSIQFGTYKVCEERGIPVDYFNSRHVKLGTAPLRDDCSELILHHYFATKWETFLPHEYKSKIV